DLRDGGRRADERRGGRRRTEAIPRARARWSGREERTAARRADAEGAEARRLAIEAGVAVVRAIRLARVHAALAARDAGGEIGVGVEALLVAIAQVAAVGDGVEDAAAEERGHDADEEQGALPPY